MKIVDFPGHVTKIGDMKYDNSFNFLFYSRLPKLEDDVRFVSGFQRN